MWRGQCGVPSAPHLSLRNHTGAPREDPAGLTPRGCELCGRSSAAEVLGPLRARPPLGLGLPGQRSHTGTSHVARCLQEGPWDGVQPPEHIRGPWGLPEVSGEAWRDPNPGSDGRGEETEAFVSTALWSVWLRPQRTWEFRLHVNRTLPPNRQDRLSE